MNLLNNAHILVTRPKLQAQVLCDLINERGGVAIALPTLEIVASDNVAQIQNTLARLSEFQWLVFISANAVNFALLANGGKIAATKSTRLVAIGKATAQALQDAGLCVDVMPELGYDSEALLATAELQAMTGQKVLIIRGDSGRDELATRLSERGACVEYLMVYKRLLPKLGSSNLSQLIAEQQLQLIIITSGESLQNLVTLTDKQQQQALRELPLVVISDRIKQLAKELGFKRIAVSAGPANTAILETIIIVCNGGTAWPN
jgi:uroporphyrinogen-III synthase